MTNTTMKKYSDCTDHELWDFWRAGDTRAGSRFCDRYFFQVYRFFTNKVRDDRDAEDLTQKTFLELTRSVAKAEPKHARGYVFGVARFVLIAYFDGKSKLGVVRIPDESIADMDPGPGMTTFVQKNDERSQLAQALRRLPLDAQILLELYYWEDMSASDIGVVLGIPEPTVRGRLRRAKDLLAAQLESQTPGVDIDQRMHSLGEWVAELQAIPRS